MTRLRPWSLVAVVLTAALLAAACGSGGSAENSSSSDSGNASTASGDAADTNSDSDTGDAAAGESAGTDATDTGGASADTDGTDTDGGDTTAEEAEPEVVATPVTLEAPAPPTDPLETINHLASVTFVPAAEGAWYVVFDQLYEDGMSVALESGGEEVAVCEIFADPMTAMLTGGDAVTENCFDVPSFLASTTVGPDPDTPPLGALFPFNVDEGTASITLAGSDGNDLALTGDRLVFGAGPVMVQIDPATGGLAEPVTRWSGSIAVADLAAALDAAAG